MLVRREDLCESVAHLQLPIERSVEVRLVRVKTAILAGTFRCGRLIVVDILVRRSRFEVGWVLCSWREFSLVAAVLRDEHLHFAHGAIVVLEALGGFFAALGSRRWGT